MICIVSGTNRPATICRSLAEHYSNLLSRFAAENFILDLADLPADFAFYFSEVTDGNSPFESVRRRIVESDRFVFVVPEYNGSYPGILKLLIDNSPFPESFRGKKCALAGLSSGMFGNLRGLDQLENVLHYLQAATLPYRIHIPRVPHENGNLFEILSAEQVSQVEEQVMKFLAF